MVSSGQSIAVLPLHALGRVVGSALGPRASHWLAGPSIARDQLVRGGEVELFFVALWNALVTAALCAVFFAFAVRLGVAPPWALLTTVLFGTTSYVVGYSSTFFTQSVEALGLLGSFYLLYLDGESPDVRLRISAGLLIAFTLQCRYPAIIMVPGLLAYQARTAHKRGGGRMASWLADTAPLVLGVMLGLGLHAADQLWKFGTIYSKGGYEKARWDAPVLTGLRGFLLSPGDSMLVYTPLLLLTPFALPGFFKRHRAEAAFVLGQSVLYLVLFSMFPNWHGLWCFGPRYMVPIVPLLMLPLGAWLEARGRRVWPVVAALALAGLWVLLLSWCGVRTWRAVRGMGVEPVAAPRSAARIAIGTAVLLMAFTVVVRVTMPGPPVYHVVTLPRVTDLDTVTAMNDAIELLYQKKAPGAALLVLDKVLAENPDHYGANFQRARALDALGRPSTEQWRRTLVLAERVHDDETARTIRARLATPR